MFWSREYQSRLWQYRMSPFCTGSRFLWAWLSYCTKFSIPVAPSLVERTLLIVPPREQRSYVQKGLVPRGYPRHMKKVPTRTSHVPLERSSKTRTIGGVFDFGLGVGEIAPRFDLSDRCHLSASCGVFLHFFGLILHALVPAVSRLETCCRFAGSVG